MKGDVNKGSIVRVNFNGAQITLSHKALVRYMPCQVGDSWVFECLDTSQIHYVSEGCTVTLLEKAVTNPTTHSIET